MNKKYMWRIGYTLAGVAAILAGGLLLAPRPRTVPAVGPPPARQAPLVVVDAGHGGFDGGSVGARGTVEAPLNLAVARRVEARLLSAGVRVAMTRTDDAALGETKQADFAARRRVMNDSADVCVSIHMNAFTDPAVQGPMAFYMQGSPEGEALSGRVVTRLCQALGRPPRPANPGDYFVIRECACPAVLVECGFLSNPTEEARLADPAYQDKLALGVAEGVIAYLRENGLLR